MNYHREILEEMMKEKSQEYLENYIKEMEDKIANMKDWLKWLKALHYKKTKAQKSLDTGSRDGR